MTAFSLSFRNGAQLCTISFYPCYFKLERMWIMTDYEKNAAVSKQIPEKNFDVINIRLRMSSSSVPLRKWHSKIIQFLTAGGSGKKDRNTALSSCPSLLFFDCVAVKFAFLSDGKIHSPSLLSCSLCEKYLAALAASRERKRPLASRVFVYTNT